MFDIALTFYRQWDHWPLVLWGLSQNRSLIHRIIVVNDGEWGEAEKEEMLEAASECNLANRVDLLGHKRDGWDYGKTFNEGVAAASTEYVVHLDGDIAMIPGALERLKPLLKPQGLVSPLTPATESPAAIEFNAWTPQFKFLRDDPRVKAKLVPYFAKIRGTFLGIHRESHLAIGGMDEIYKGGYGNQDYDYCIRWMEAFGIDSTQVGPFLGWHMGEEVPGALCPQKTPDPALKELFESRWLSFWKKHVNV